MFGTFQQCGRLTYVQTRPGDDQCNDENNDAKCQYDLGDCCLNEIDDTSCDECICHEDGTRHPSKFQTNTEKPEDQCDQIEYVNDGICDDITNVEECDFDGNDCCLDEIVDYFCIDCICHYLKGNVYTLLQKFVFCPKIQFYTNIAYNLFYVNKQLTKM